ncbi:hypothetical protein ACIGO6_27200 [Streptomyces sp. NPDC053750]|uniref:hypothetical protein n=1 Tax=Streptomyces sp. NPDC053750 TaxID=3365714 RepID=UPI0037D3D9B9
MSHEQIRRPAERADDLMAPAKPQWQDLFKAPAYGPEVAEPHGEEEVRLARRPRQRRGGRSNTRAA